MPDAPSHISNGTVSSKVLTRYAVAAALEKRAEDVLVMDVRLVSGLADYFVLCSGSSSLQIAAIQESIEKHIREQANERPWHREGQEFRQWVLLDYVDVVVHIFSGNGGPFLTWSVSGMMLPRRALQRDR